MDLATQSNEPYHQRGAGADGGDAQLQTGRRFSWTGSMTVSRRDADLRPQYVLPRRSPLRVDRRLQRPCTSSPWGRSSSRSSICENSDPTFIPRIGTRSLTNSRRYHNIFDFCMDTVLIDRTYPVIGDSGSFPAYEKALQDLPGTVPVPRPSNMPTNSSAIPSSPGPWPIPHGSRRATCPFTREEIEAEAAKWLDDWNDASSLHDGYGIGILRGGKGRCETGLLGASWSCEGPFAERSDGYRPGRIPGRPPLPHGISAELGTLGTLLVESPRRPAVPVRRIKPAGHSSSSTPAPRTWRKSGRRPRRVSAVTGPARKATPTTGSAAPWP